MQIPIGNFGQSVARPGPMASVPRDNPLGEAAQRTGQIAARVVNDMAEQETRLQLQQRDEELRKQREAQAAAEKATYITTLKGTQARLKEVGTEVSQGVLDGTVPKDKAESEYASRSAKVLEGVGDNLPEHLRQIVRAELGADATELAGGVRKVVVQRNREDVTAGITQTLEYLQREYRANPDRATSQAMSTIDQLGPHSTLGPDHLVKLKQTWKEGTQFTAAYDLVSAGRNDRKALDAAERAITNGFPDLDPQRRATLTDRVGAYRLALDQKAEMAAARAEREAERRMRKAEAEFNVFQGMADKGTVLAPEYIDRALTATAGTPYAAGITALARQAAAGTAIAAQPVTVQQRALDEVNALIAQRGRSPELDQRKDQIEKVLRGSQQDVERDALRAGLERGVITELRPLDLSKGVAGMVQQLQQERMPQADRVSTWAGRPVSPMTAEESEQFKAQLETLPAKERAGVIAAVAQAIGPQGARGLAAQMDKKDDALKYAFLYSNGWTSAGRRVSELILAGQQGKKDGTSTKGEKSPELKASQWSAHIATELQGLFPAQSVTNDMREAALLIAHGLAAEESGQLRTKDLDRAVQFAINGSIVEYNGRRLPLPVGVDESMLARRVRSVTAQDIIGQTAKLPTTAPGLLEPGNIDLSKRPIVKNPDGSISTVRSVGVNIDGKEVLLPTVGDGGKVVSIEDAVATYRRTGKHLGKFESPEASTAYAQALHDQQASAYLVRAGGVPMSIDDFIRVLPGQPLMPLRPGVYTPLVNGRPVVNGKGEPIAIGVR